MTMPSNEFMRSHVAVRWKDSIVVLSTKRRRIWIYNLWTEQWKKHQLSRGKWLPVDEDQRGVEIQSDIYMFGGFSYPLWKLAMHKGESVAWNKIEIKFYSKTPSQREGHSVWKHNDKMWIFGGYGMPPVGHLNDHGEFVSCYSGGVNGVDFGHNNQLLSYDPCIETWTNVMFWRCSCTSEGCFHSNNQGQSLFARGNIIR